MSRFTQTMIGLTPVTIAERLFALRQYFKYAFLNGYVTKPIEVFLSHPPQRLRTKLPTVWSEEQIEKLIRSVDIIWAESRIAKIDDAANKEQVLQNYEIEKKVWIDFQRHLGYNYNLDEILLSTYIQEFSMVSKEEEPCEDSVQFLTIHASKGKEFDHVILIGMANDELPSFQSLKKGLQSTEMEEERRNCFVAITRTKKVLYLTYAKSYFGWRKDKSVFLNEMFS